jgi:hypothetical protein
MAQSIMLIEIRGPYECQIFVKLCRCCENSDSQIGLNEDLSPVVCLEVSSGTELLPFGRILSH